MTPAERLDVFRRLADAVGWRLPEEHWHTHCRVCGWTLEPLPADGSCPPGCDVEDGHGCSLRPRPERRADDRWLRGPDPDAPLPAHLEFCGHVIEAVRLKRPDYFRFQIQNDHVGIGALVASCTTRGDLALACARAALAALDALGVGGEG